MIEADQRANIMLRQPGLRIDQKLLGELDDRAVGAADVPAGAALRPEARDDLDDEVDLVRQQRIEIDEGLSVDLGQPRCPRSMRVC